MPSALISISTRAWLRAKSSTSSSRGTRSPAKSALNQRPASNWRTWSPKRSATNPVPLVVRLSAASCKTTIWPSRVAWTSISRISTPIWRAFRKRPTYSRAPTPDRMHRGGQCAGGVIISSAEFVEPARVGQREGHQASRRLDSETAGAATALGKFIGRVGQRPRAGYDRGHWVPTVAVHNRRSRVVASDDE